MNDAVRQHQGRPGGAARRRRRLHGRRPGHDRPRRLADDGVPDARRPAVLRRHLLPRRPGTFGFASCWRPSTTPGATAATSCVEQAGQLTEALGRTAAARPGRRPARRRRARPAPSQQLRASVRRRVGRLRRGAEVPADDEPRAAAAGPPLAAAAPTRSPIVTTVARRHGVGRHLRPPRRRLRPLLGRRAAGWCPTSRRCSTTRRCWSGSTCTPGRSPARPATARCVDETIDYVLRDLRHPDGGFYSAEDADSREGEEGRFYVWTRREVARRRSAPTLAAAAVEWYGVTEAGNFEGRNILQPPASAATSLRPPEVERARARLFDGPRERGPARARRQGADRVERADAGDPGRGRRRDRRRGDWLDAAAAERRVPAAPSCAAPTAAGCGRGRPTARRPPPAPTPPTTPRWSTPSPAWPRPPARPAGSTRPGRPPTRCSTCSGTPTAAACSPPADDAEALDRPPEGPARQRHAVGQLAWPPSACSGWPPSPASERYADQADADPAAARRRRRRAPRRPSRTCWPPSTCGAAGVTEVAVVGDRPDLVAAVQRPLPAQRRAGLGRAATTRRCGTTAATAWPTSATTTSARRRSTPWTAWSPLLDWLRRRRTSAAPP